MPSNRSSARRRPSITPSRKGKTKNASSGGGDLYQLESLKDYEVRNGIEYFLVKWEGYPDEQNTWEPVSNIVHPTQELIDQMKQLRLLSQTSQKPSKARKSTSKKRKIESITERKSRPLKSQKVVETEAASPSQSHKRQQARETKENDQPQNTVQREEPPLEIPRENQSGTGGFEATTSQTSSRVGNLHSPRTLSHNEEDTSPEEASASHLRLNRMTKEAPVLPTTRPALSPAKEEAQQSGDHLKEELVVVESVCKESRAQPFDNQENFFPICPEGLQFLSHLSVIVKYTQVVQTDESNKVEIKKVKMPLLEVAEKHTKALLAYFLQNVRYYKHSKPTPTDEGEKSQPEVPQQRDAGCQAETEVKESQTQTCDSVSGSSPQKPVAEDVSLPVTPNDRRSVATVPHSAVSRSTTGNKLVTVG